MGGGGTAWALNIHLENSNGCHNNKNVKLVLASPASSNLFNCSTKCATTGDRQRSQEEGRKREWKGEGGFSLCGCMSRNEAT